MPSKLITHEDVVQRFAREEVHIATAVGAGASGGVALESTDVVLSATEALDLYRDHAGSAATNWLCPIDGQSKCEPYKEAIRTLMRLGVLTP
jgi:hypothetical protein